MNMDLDRIAVEAQNKGEQHFSFTNAAGGGQDTAKNKAGSKDQLKMIQENDSNDSFILSHAFL